ncbi:hypothetical protein ABW21_db0204457 [Orbilia brochopaga]|nr:hypothetical protein ABW21_db0204457 [Drechslerella brochopaga]
MQHCSTRRLSCAGTIRSPLRENASCSLLKHAREKRCSRLVCRPRLAGSGDPSFGWPGVYRYIDRCPDDSGPVGLLEFESDAAGSCWRETKRSAVGDLKSLD